MYETLLFSVTDHIATITFNRPQAMNAFNQVMANELKLLTEVVKNDVAIRAVHLTGAGTLFMAGGDIKFFYDNLKKMPMGVRQIVETLNASIINLLTMTKPVLASVHGSVAGVGMSLMMACDLAIAADNTQFTLAYSGIGISPDGGASYLLPRLVGTKKAMEWLLLSERFDANQAKNFGLINWVVPADQLKDKTDRLLKRLGTGPTYSYAAIKRLVNSSWQTSLEEHLNNEREAFEACSVTADFKMGVKSFLQKAKPEFEGV